MPKLCPPPFQLFLYCPKGNHDRQIKISEYYKGATIHDFDDNAGEDDSSASKDNYIPEEEKNVVKANEA